MKRNGWRFTVSAMTVALSLTAAGAPGGAAGTGPAAGVVQIAQSTAETGTWEPTRAQIRAAQLRLKQLDFDPGVVDGSFGPRSAAALRAYQASLGLEPDGDLTESVFARLMGLSTPREETLSQEAPPAETLPQEAPEVAEPAPPPTPPANPETPALAEPMVNPPAGAAADCDTSIMGLWAFRDDQGSQFRLGLLDGGMVEGPFYSEHWSWKPIPGGGIEIRYDNGMGVSVIRSGTLQQDGQLSGTAEDSRGNTWAWRAARVTDSAAGAAPTCSPSG